MFLSRGDRDLGAAKDLKRPSSTRLEATFPYHGSGAMTRSPSPLAWRPEVGKPKSRREDSESYHRLEKGAMRAGTEDWRTTQVGRGFRGLV